MCGRFSLHLPTKTITEFFLLSSKLEDVQPRYNIAPTQPVLTVLRMPQQRGKNVALPLHWGLIPAWAKDMKIAQKLTNARGETLREKPSFRGAFKYRRCLIPTSGFYEWKSAGKRKQPFYITSPNGEPLAFAGLWEHWSGPQGEEITSVTIITTEANGVMEPIHHRMPVILAKEHFSLWLDETLQDGREVSHLIKPCPDTWLTTFPVSTYVSNFRNQGPQCIERLQEPPEREHEQMSLF